jgi:peptidoglycan hydrolase-like protein with peptidoglycan-binding domain
MKPDHRTRNRGARRVLTTTAATLAIVVAAAGAAYGVLELRGGDGSLRDRALDFVGASGSTESPSGPAADSSEPSGSSAPTPSPTPEEEPPTPGPTATIEPKPEPVLEPGDRGRQVRELQVRLNQLAWYGPITTGSYATDTRTAVGGFQAKRGFERTGLVDERTWRRLVRMTTTPTEAQLFNRPGPALYAAGDQGRSVREIQARLRQIAWYFGDVNGSYDSPTVEAVTGFQGKRGIPRTGEVDQRTLDLLEGMTVEPTADDLANREPEIPDAATGAPLDPRCTTGMALCIDKTTSSLRWVVDGDVQTSVDVRFGSDELPTREGVFSVFSKSRDHVSSLYDTSMPFAMFFSGGQAVHYSPDFAANGYAGASHGCVNVRDYDAIAALFDQVPIGTRVVVYWS